MTRNEAAERLRLLMHEADIRWPDEHTRIAASAFDEWFDAALAHAKDEGRKEALAVWPQGFVYVDPVPDD